MNSHFHSVAIVSLAIAGAVALPPTARSANFSFGASQNNLNGLESKTLVAGGYSMWLSTALAGTQLNEPQGAGLGVNSSPLVGADDPNAALFNVIGGSGPMAGQGERVHFKFDKPGVLTGINFDGVKDESLEYFILETPGGARYNFFDSAANTTIAGVVDSAIAAQAITGSVIYLLENSLYDDEARNLTIAFGSGEQFTLTYAELGPQFHPTLLGNGARLQGITVEAVPEPGAVTLLGLCVGLRLLAVRVGNTRRRR